MFFTLIIALLIILVGTLLISKKLFIQSRIPKHLKVLPKIKGWPFVGILLSFKKPLFSHLYHLKGTHGPIFEFRMGNRDLIVLNTFTVMNKALKEDGINFSGRWKDVEVIHSLHNTGILFQDKELWEIQRSFIMRVLRDFGLGKKRSEEIVNFECEYLLKELEETCGSVVSGRLIFPKYTVNVIAKLVMNMRFEKSDLNFQTLTRLVEKLAQTDTFFDIMILMYPILEKMPTLSKILLNCIGRGKLISQVQFYIKDIISEHEKRYNNENEGEDLIDMFLKEREKLNKNGIKNHTFTEWQLINVSLELFAAGYETTATTLSWGMILLAKHPDIQENTYREIVNVVGLARTPNISEKKSLHYTQAVMDEIFRISSVVPLSIPHQVFKDTDIEGYFIPKNSVILPNIYSVHHDEDVWEKPFEFYPEHFLINTDGMYKYNHREQLMPFGIGKRQCLGESLARLELFTFLTSIIQRFKVTFPKTIDNETFKQMTIGTDGLIRAPLNTDIIFELRHH